MIETGKLISDIAYLVFVPFGGAQIVNGRRTREFQLEQKEKDMQFQMENTALERAHKEKMAQYNRETTQLVAWENACLNLRNEFIKDALAKFPLNISPYVLLGNNGIMLQDISIDHINERSLPPHNLPLNIFIAPLSSFEETNALIPKGNSAKNMDMPMQEFSQYINSELEKIFIGSFSRNSVRPTAFYSASYKPGVVPGLHVADELYFFLKDLPTIVVEPKYDGKKLLIVISFWSMCFENTALEQVCVEIDFDWKIELCKKSYEQSLRMQNILSNSDFINNEKVQSLLQYHEKVIETSKAFGVDKLLSESIENAGFSYERREELSFLFEKAGLSKIFQIDSLTAREAAKPLTQALGVMLCMISDVHHAITSQKRGREYRPILPDLIPTVFPNLKKEYKLFIMDKYNDLSEALISMSNDKNISIRYFEWMMPMVRDDEVISNKMNIHLIKQLRNITGSQEKDLDVLLEQYCQSDDRSFDNVLFAFLRRDEIYRNKYAHVLSQLKPESLL